jgi:hypothetical protein
MVSTKKLEVSAPFSAKVESIDIITNVTPALVYISMKTSDGRRIALGGEEEGYKLLEFAGKLSKWQTYEFPKTWVEFQESKKKAGTQR